MLPGFSLGTSNNQHVLTMVCKCYSLKEIPTLPKTLMATDATELDDRHDVDAVCSPLHQRRISIKASQLSRDVWKVSQGASGDMRAGPGAVTGQPFGNALNAVLWPDICMSQRTLPS